MDGRLAESWMYGEKDTDGQTDGWLVERWWTDALGAVL